MRKIIFRLRDEYDYFRQLIKHKNIILNERKKKHGYVVHVHKISDEQLVSYFVNVYITYHFQQRVEKIISEQYFYKNKEEIEQVVQWTNWLLQESTFMKQQFNEQSLITYLSKLLLKQFRTIRITDDYIHYDTFVLFQFKPFHQELIYIIGYAIDEMKREEEHQHYIQSIRHYIINNSPKCSIVHILQGEVLQFFSSSGQEYTYEQLRALIEKEPLYIFGLDKNETNIASAIALLPRRLYIYGDHPYEAKVIGLLNIFQERACFLSKERFPFKI